MNTQRIPWFYSKKFADEYGDIMEAFSIKFHRLLPKNCTLSKLIPNYIMFVSEEKYSDAAVKSFKMSTDGEFVFKAYIQRTLYEITNATKEMCPPSVKSAIVELSTDEAARWIMAGFMSLSLTMAYDRMDRTPRKMRQAESELIWQWIGSISEEHICIFKRMVEQAVVYQRPIALAQMDFDPGYMLPLFD